MRFDQYVSLVCLVAGLILLPLKPTLAPAPPAVGTSFGLQLHSELIPVLQSAAGDHASTLLATMSAQAVYVIDVPSASILLAKNADQLAYPASTTKLMTALVAVDTFALDRVLTFDENSVTDGTTIGLEVAEELTVQDLLQGLLIQSGNDAAMVLANNHPQGYDGFIQAMNNKARQLHLDHTTFSNPSGLDSFDHQSSARDLAILSLEIIKHPVLSQIVKTKTSTVTDVELVKSHPLVNTNALLALKPEIVGLKTGTTPLAGEVLITRYKNQDRDLVGVVMGSQDRYGETERLYAWILSHYIWLSPDSVTLTMQRSQPLSP